MTETLPAISHQIWDQKYRFKQFDGTPIDETLQETWRRVAKALASVEKDAALWEGRFFDVMNLGYFSPAGRIISGAGTGRNVTLLNCFVMGTVPDSMDGIFSAIKEAALTMQQGGGIGYDFSTIRPRGAEVKGVAADASGPLSFMDVWDSMCRTVMSAGSRRGAMMATMRCDHPDIEAFIEVKRDPAKLRMFNLSVLVTDAFMDAVKNDLPWRLHFENRRGETLVERTIQARDLWNKIMRNTYDCAEPGVIFIDRINAANNLRAIEIIAATNPCGEQPLPPYGACLLGSINVAKCILNPFTPEARIDSYLLQEVVAVAVRMMDNVIDVSGYPLEQQAEEAHNKRRIGLGVTGLADALIMLGEVYGSEMGVTVTDHIMKSIAVFSYRASAELAKEKGAYPLFDVEHVLAEGTHASTLPEIIQSLIRKHGLRNSHLTSIAPTGTISLLAGNVSSGIEPVFALSYDRKVLQPDGSKITERVEDYAVTKYRELHPDRGEMLPDYFVTAQTLPPEAHLRMQAAAQKWVDSSISKTINLPEDISFEAFQQVYLDAYDMGCKGCTTYRPNEVTGSVLSVAPEAKKVVVFTGTMENVTRAQMKEWAEADGWTVSGSIGPNTTLVVAGPGAGSKLKVAEDRGIETISCEEWLSRSGRSLKNLTTFTLNTDGVNREALLAAFKASHPMIMLDTNTGQLAIEPTLTERPATLNGETIKIKWPGSPHALYVTICDVVEDGRRRPFEIFINSKNMEHFAWTVALTRMVSAVFRRPHDSRFVVEELKAVFDPKGGAWMEGKYVPSVLAAIGGAIETHMKNIGYIEADVVEKVQVAGPTCPACGSSNTKHESGCFQCLDCGNSKCG